MPMTCHDRTSTALVFEITLSVAIEPDSEGQAGRGYPTSSLCSCSFFCRKSENTSGDIVGAFQSRVA